jgi:hypothetical protein
MLAWCFVYRPEALGLASGVVFIVCVIFCQMMLVASSEVCCIRKILLLLLFFRSDYFGFAVPGGLAFNSFHDVSWF